MSKKAKVTAFVKAANKEALLSFDKNFPEAQWFAIPNGYAIRAIDREVYFDSAPKEHESYQTGKIIVVGFTPQVAIAALLAQADCVVFSNLLKKEIIEVETFKLRW